MLPLITRIPDRQESNIKILHISLMNLLLVIREKYVQLLLVDLTKTYDTVPVYNNQ